MIAFVFGNRLVESDISPIGEGLSSSLVRGKWYFVASGIGSFVGGYALRGFVAVSHGEGGIDSREECIR